MLKFQPNRTNAAPLYRVLLCYYEEKGLVLLYMHTPNNAISY